MALEIILSIETDIIIVQKPFIGNQKIFHSKFNFYWPKKERKNIKIMIAIKKKQYTIKQDFVNYLYFILLKIQELDPKL